MKQFMFFFFLQKQTQCMSFIIMKSTIQDKFYKNNGNREEMGLPLLKHKVVLDAR